MSFEEQFPSLKGKDFRITFNGQKIEATGFFDADFFYKRAILENCLDKQKVRDAINRISEHLWDKKTIDQLKKELRL